MDKIRLGPMGFGRIGRQLYRLALLDGNIDIVAISNVGRPDVLHHLPTRTVALRDGVELNGNESRQVHPGSWHQRCQPANEFHRAQEHMSGALFADTH